MNKIYYRNEEVEYLQDIGDNRALILLPWSYGQTSDGEWHGDDVEIIVSKNDLKDKKVDIGKEYSKMLISALKQAREISEDVKAEVKAIKAESEKRLVDLKKQIELYIGVEESLRFMNPEYEYIVTLNYGRYDIKQMSKLKNNDGWNSGGAKFQAITIRHQNTGLPKTFVSKYQDGSDSSGERILGYFKTREEAKEFVTPLVEDDIKKSKNNVFRKGLREMCVQSDIIDGHLKEVEDKANKENEKEIAKAERHLQNLKRVQGEKK